MDSIECSFFLISELIYYREENVTFVEKLRFKYNCLINIESDKISYSFRKFKFE